MLSMEELTDNIPLLPLQEKSCKTSRHHDNCCQEEVPIPPQANPNTDPSCNYSLNDYIILHSITFSA